MSRAASRSRRSRGTAPSPPVQPRTEERPAPPQPLPDPPSRSAATFGRRIHAAAASSLMLVFVAVMSGHMTSMDGFLMQRQARALVFEQSINFRTPGWFWMGEPVYSSKFGLGMSLAYVPGMMFASPLVSLVPHSEKRPKDTFAFYYRQLYQDPLYTVGASWAHATITAVAAYVVGRLVLALGGTMHASLWAMALFGIGSSALVYSRGDFTQPLVGLCWVAALLAAIRFRETASTHAIWATSAAVGYAVLTRPFDGLLVFLAVLALVTPLEPSKWNLRAIRPAFTVALGVVVAVVVTAVVNWARTGDALTTGYRLENAWSLPDFQRIAHVLVGPARGVLWDFPAVLLLPLGVAALRARAKGFETAVLLALAGALLLNTASWKVWWGGWCWGLRLFIPALPVLAVVAGAGVDRLGPRTRVLLPALLLLAGFVCALPAVVTDPLQGFARFTDGAPLAWSLASFRPVGAWRFLERAFPTHPLDTDVVDILWFRLAPATGYWTLVVPVLLIALAAALAAWCVRESRREAAGAATS